ncbi:MAG: hypothetical protein GY862_23430 [Gammaproteobacteria bacterium]|nr:hypothetical protein [Gammaproteobacteria bacterium]
MTQLQRSLREVELREREAVKENGKLLGKLELLEAKPGSRQTKKPDTA